MAGGDAAGQAAAGAVPDEKLNAPMDLHESSAADKKDKEVPRKAPLMLSKRSSRCVHKPATLGRAKHPEPLSPIPKRPQRLQKWLAGGKTGKRRAHGCSGEPDSSTGRRRSLGQRPRERADV